MLYLRSCSSLRGGPIILVCFSRVFAVTGSVCSGRRASSISHKQTYRSEYLESSAELQKTTHSRLANLPVSDELLRKFSASIRFPSGCGLSIAVRVDTAIGCCSRVARLPRVWSSTWMVALRGNERCAGYLRGIVYERGSPLFADRAGSQRGWVSPVGTC